MVIRAVWQNPLTTLPSVSELTVLHTNPSGLEVSKINQQDNPGITGRGTVSMASDFIVSQFPFKKFLCE